MSDFIGTLGTIGAFVGSIVSILLWITTKSTLKEVKKQNDSFSKSLESETISKIMSSHQSIFLNVLNNGKLKTKFSGYSDDGKFEESIMGTLLINHFFMIYSFSQKGFLAKDDWIGLQSDIQDAFKSMPLVKDRWNEINKFYSIEFQEFIKKLSEQGRLS